MANFDELIKKSLSVVNDGFQRTLADLTALVEQVNSAIKQHAGPQCGLVLEQIDSDMKGANYRLSLDTEAGNPQAPRIGITHFRLLPKGYPLLHGRYNQAKKMFLGSEFSTLADQKQVEEYFANLLQDPDSSLIQAMGFALRLQARVAPAGEAKPATPSP